MKSTEIRLLDEFRDPVLARRLLGRLKAVSRKPVTLMEVCGSHTVAIHRSGLKQLLPRTIRLVSGPGCPVCVTSQADIDRAISVAERPDVTFATFGDMMRVPGSRQSLQEAKADGADVRVVYSPMDALEMALGNPGRRVVFFAAGFETTAPAVAATLVRARRARAENFLVFPVHKLIPPAMRALLAAGDVLVDGFIAPGHVSVIIGSQAYEFIAEEFGRPSVVTGFEPVDLLQGILMLVKSLESGRAAVDIQYSRTVQPRGNPRAMELIERVFEPADAWWRGLGLIPGSGLALREGYAGHDAGALATGVFSDGAGDLPGCSCGDVLKGKIEPNDCPLFDAGCTPDTPVGPCMVSAEGSCAALYKYGGGRSEP